MKTDVERLSHTKYGRKVFYGSKRLEIVKILKELCK